ncbi:LPXTG cell wall anchor domain-containing protein [Isoptericola haloaureus]|uniref:LPXTG cell wall anchor domain-containing protein n=1 Tax=Isoptericola haloaureus TaxID=1542902 RepID=A0ABU7Z9I9_9MICO
MIAAAVMVLLGALVALPGASATPGGGGVSTGNGNGNGNGNGQQTCPDDGEWSKVDGLTGTEYLAEASPGHLIVEVCVKSAQAVETITVDPPATSFLIVSPSVNGQGSTQDISHVSVREIEDNGGWPYPAPTCQAGLTVTYPDGVSGNDVNIRVRNLDTDATRTFNFHLGTERWTGVQNFDPTTLDEWPGWTRYVFEWVQVDGTNYHWEGFVECDEPEPSPSPTPTPSEEPSPSPTPSEEPSPSPTPSEEPSPSPTPSEEPSPTPTPSEEPSPSPTPSEEPTPEPVEPSLAGSLAAGECVADAPWIVFDVTLTDPDDQVSERAVILELTDGTHVETLELGTLGADGTLSGRTLWPGASVADDGVTPTGWPGWTRLEDGTWVQTNGNYAWTRGDIDATLVVNPEVAVELAYPEATPVCAAVPPQPEPEPSAEPSPEPSEPGDEATPEEEPSAEPTSSPTVEAESDTDELPRTGSNVTLIAVGALALVAAGGAFLWLRRRA